MKIIVLGPNGQLGTDLARVVEKFDGVELIPVGRDELDVTNPEAIQAVLGERDFDALINCTSYHKTDEVESNAKQAVAVNAHGVRDLAEACKASGARFVHISTDYVFDGLADTPYTEDSPIGPLNVYGATKAMGESLARTSNPDTLIFRVASLFGVAGASGKGGNFVETMIKYGREKGALRVIADQVMSPTSTYDLADALLRALTQAIPAGTYHLTNTGQASWYEFAAAIIQKAGVESTVDPIPATEYPLPARRPAYSVLDNSKLVSQIGPIRSWEEALDQYLVDKGHMVAAG